jgi:hypothetical protein
MRNNIKETLGRHKKIIGLVAAAAFVVGLLYPNGLSSDVTADKVCTQDAAGPTGDPHTYQVCTGNPHNDPDNNPTGNPHNT